MKNFLILFVLFFIFFKTNAQSPEGEIASLLDLGYSLELEKPDSAILIYKQAAILCKKNNDTLNLGRSIQYQGIVFSNMANYDSAEFYFKKSIVHFSSQKYYKGVAATYNNLANMAQFQSDYEEAIDFYLKAIEEFKKIDDQLNIGNTENNMANVFFELKMYDKAIEHSQSALKKGRALKDSILIADAAHTIGNSLDEKGEVTAAVEYFNESIGVAEAIGNQYGLMLNYSSLVDVYLESDAKKALGYAKRSNELAVAINAPTHICNSYAAIGVAQDKLGLYDAAIDNLELAINQSKELDMSFHQMRYIGYMINAIAHKEGRKTIDKYFEEYNDLKDTIYNIEKNKAVAELEIKYQTAEKEKQIAQQELEINKKTNQRNILIASSFLLTLLGFGIYYFAKQKTKRNKLIAEKKRRTPTTKNKRTGKNKPPQRPRCHDNGTGRRTEKNSQRPARRPRRIVGDSEIAVRGTAKRNAENIRIKCL